MTALTRRLYGSPALLLTLTMLFWAGNTVAGQLAVGHVQPFQLVLLRWVMVAAALWPLFGGQIRAHWPQARRRLGRIALTATLGFTCFNALFYIASHETTAVNIGILQGSMPMFVLAGAFIAHRTPVRPLQALGVACTVAGVVLVATKGDPVEALRLGVNRGDLIMLLACVFYSIYTIALKDRPEMPGSAFFAMMAIVAALAAVPFAAAEALGQGFRPPTLQGWLVTLYVAVFPSCLAQLFFLRGVDLIGPGRAGVFINLVPVFAAFLGVTLLGEVFAWSHAVALVLVLGGIALSQRFGPRG